MGRVGNPSTPIEGTMGGGLLYGDRAIINHKDLNNALDEAWRHPSTTEKDRQELYKIRMKAGEAFWKANDQYVIGGVVSNTPEYGEPGRKDPQVKDIFGHSAFEDVLAQRPNDKWKVSDDLATKLVDVMASLEGKSLVSATRAVERVLVDKAFSVGPSARETLLSVVQKDLGDVFRSTDTHFALTQVLGEGDQLTRSGAQHLAAILERIVTVEGHDYPVREVKEALGLASEQMESGANTVLMKFVDTMEKRPQTVSAANVTFQPCRAGTTSAAAVVGYKKLPASFEIVKSARKFSWGDSSKKSRLLDEKSRIPARNFHEIQKLQRQIDQIGEVVPYQNGIQVTPPNHGLPELFQAAASGKEILLGAQPSYESDGAKTTLELYARFEEETREFVFSLRHDAESEAPFSALNDVRVPFKDIATAPRQKLVFEREFADSTANAAPRGSAKQASADSRHGRGRNRSRNC